MVFPSPDPNARHPLKMAQIRHTYLHYLLDPMAENISRTIKRLEPLLQSVKRAPLEESFKTDISLLVTECLVRAIEIRTTGNKQTAEAMRHAGGGRRGEARVHPDEIFLQRAGGV